MKPTHLPVKKIVLATVVFIIAIRLLQIWALDFLNREQEEYLVLSYLIKSGFNFIYVLGAFWAIKKYNLASLGGLGKQRFKNWWLVLFPLYLVILNFDTDLDYASIPASRYLALGLLTVSIGLSEEYLLRSLLQSTFLKQYATSKKRIFLAVLGAALIFGLLHLVKFDKGLYGEIGQVFFATFIGVMFGAILLRINTIWPLVIVHTLIDFAAKMDELPLLKDITETTEAITETSNSGLGDMITIILITAPCLLYGLLLLKKVTVADIQQKI